MIPKIVHMTCKNFSQLPLEISIKNKNLERLNHDYEFRYYDDESMLNWIFANCDKKTCEAFLSINPNYGAAKADLFRYLVLNNVGGVYLDVKSSCLVPLDTLIRPSDQFITSHWMKDDGTIDTDFGRHLSLSRNKLIEYQQWFVISQPRNLLLFDLIYEIVSNLQKKPNIVNTKFGRVGVLESTGPIIFTKVISKYQEGQDFTLINSKKSGLVYSIYEKDSTSIHYKLFATHYSRLLEPIVKGSDFSFYFATLFNKYIKQHALRIQFKIYKWFNKI
jgi:mannosyltransferase OCH1-like enzyme